MPYVGPRWKINQENFNEKQDEIANMAIEVLKNKPKDNDMTEGQWLLKYHPEINERYERLLKYFGLL